jgi:hypothetical protein
MVDQTRRSGCGLWYSDHHDLRAATEILSQNPELAEPGPAWVGKHYAWPNVTQTWRRIIDPDAEMKGSAHGKSTGSAI